MAIPSQSFWQRRVLDRLLAAPDARTNIRLKCTHIEVLKAAIRHSGIVAVMVRGTISEDHDLVWRGLTPPVEIRAYLCRRPHAVLSLANQALLNFFTARAPLGTA
jgi:DNA-binding transcriptional LysR family regulator